MITTSVHFDCGGWYVETEEGFRWNAKEAINYGITFKTSSIEDITYSVLERRIRKKLCLDMDTGLKFSYIPLVVGAKKQVYIYDDEDVETFLCSMDVGHLRSVLHVEVDKSIDEEDIRVAPSSVVGSNGDSVVVIPTANNAIVIHEEERDHRNDEVDEECMNIVSWEKSLNEHVIADGYISNDGDGCDPSDGGDPGDGCDPGVEGTQFVEEWEDGMGLEHNQEFACKNQVKEIVLRASLDKCFEYNVLNSDSWRYVVRCRQRGCDWYLRVARPEKSLGCWSVKVYRKLHSCSRVSTRTSNVRRRGVSDVVASIVGEDYPGQLDTPPAKSLMKLVQVKAGLKVSYSSALRGKNKAADVVRGCPADSYKMLPSYLYMLKKANTNTVTRLVVDDESRFKYVFIALGACIEGFNNMRKVISVDATWLKTVYKGSLIIATAQDPNLHHYPVAFGVVDGENDLSWNWFFTTLKTVIPDDSELVFLSDRNPSLIKAVREVYPSASHGYCVYHISQNVRKYAPNVHKDFVSAKFRDLAQIYTKEDFLKEYVEFRERYPKVAQYLDDSVDLEKWARCYFPGMRYNIATTNAAESLNNVFRESRKYSLLLLLDTVIAKMGEWFNNHRNYIGSLNSRKLVPYVENKIHDRYVDAKRLTVSELNLYMRQYNVVGKDGKGYLVNLRELTCDCKRFDLDKYPCVHAITAYFMYNCSPYKPEDLHIHELCSPYYSLDQWTLAYSRTIFPVPHMSRWLEIPKEVQENCVLPPPMKRKKGRPQETRFPSDGERRRTSNRSVPGLNLEECFNSSNTGPET